MFRKGSVDLLERMGRELDSTPNERLYEDIRDKFKVIEGSMKTWKSEHTESFYSFTRR